MEMHYWEDDESLESANILILSLYGPNRGKEIVKYQKKVFDKFDITINQIECPFPSGSHGFWLDQKIAEAGNDWDYLITMDMDAIPLDEYFLRSVVDKIQDGKTIFGGAQQSNHIRVNGSLQHVYISPCFLAISQHLYSTIGRPSFNHNDRGDCAEELTWRVKEMGGTVAAVYPSKVIDRCYMLDNGLSFGQGTTYGDIVYHQYCQEKPDSEGMFIAKCKEVLGEV